MAPDVIFLTFAFWSHLSQPLIYDGNSADTPYYVIEKPVEDMSDYHLRDTAKTTSLLFAIEIFRFINFRIFLKELF